jgi:hypothetical protein
VNGDGLIQPSEIRFADSAAYLGSDIPKYTLNGSTTLSMFNGRLNMNTAVSYTNGLTQLNNAANRETQIYNNPQSTFSQQALVAASLVNDVALSDVQTISELRWSTLSIGWITPQHVARWVRSSQVELSLQGSNLALHSNYSGKDPNVNVWSSGSRTVDAGQLPQPRTWSVRVDLR